MLTKDQRLTDTELDELDAACNGRAIHVFQPAEPRRKQTKDDVAGCAEWEVVFRPPTRLQVIAFKEATDPQATKGKRAQAHEDLCRACVIRVAGTDPKVPPTVSFDALVEAFGFMPVTCANAIAKVAGFDEAARGE